MSISESDLPVKYSVLSSWACVLVIIHMESLSAKPRRNRTQRPADARWGAAGRARRLAHGMGGTYHSPVVQPSGAAQWHSPVVKARRGVEPGAPCHKSGAWRPGRACEYHQNPSQIINIPHTSLIKSTKIPRNHPHHGGWIRRLPTKHCGFLSIPGKVCGT